LTVQRQFHGLPLDRAAVDRLQNQIAVSVNLEPGTYQIKLQPQRPATQAEPQMMLWIYGGRVINAKTGVKVSSTWSSLNGYDDVLNLDVLEPATLAAFFLATGSALPEQEIQLVIIDLH
jgi:phosphate transport system substrate-binding protein